MTVKPYGHDSDWGIEFDRARWRLQYALRRPSFRNSPNRNAWRGLVMRWGGVRHAKVRPHVPSGWKAVKEWDRCTWLVMPLWLYPFFRARRDWQHWLYPPLMRAGLWDLPEDGYYRDGRWTWCFWRTRAKQRREFRERVDAIMRTK